MLSIVPLSPANAARDRWKPPVGVSFNDPTGNADARGEIVTRLKRAIKHTHKGSTIRLSSFSFDRMDVAKLLIRAHRRGVHVQMVVMDHTAKTDTLPDETEDADDPEAEPSAVKPKPNKAQKRIVRELGQSRKRSSFIVFCTGSCRKGKTGDLHTKIYSFSRTGAAKYVVMATSGNLTNGSAFAQWNDMNTIVGDKALYRTWVKVFLQLKADRKAKPRRINYSSPVRSVYFFKQAAGAAQRTTSTTPALRRGSSDPVIQRLDKVGCKAPRGTGSAGRTVVRVIMYGWYGGRGDRIARKVASLRRSGCLVKVIGSVLGPSTASILRGAKIPMKAADWDFGDRVSTNGQKLVTGPRCYSHYKVLAISGSYAGKRTKAVWTGSENWSAVSYSNDEVTLRLNGGRVYSKYFHLFSRMWKDKDATHPVGVKPTRRPCHG
ncbi:phospholipase D-like domain-containing protein [Nocardioides sp. URHA0020]|uniref:phospholipase D-like domain-containing protein n=1 Tax=Nocardioides sp. URHA0020 TaxID=1380392 RepID=UPI0004911D97|nr:phospholipase D-like domain-containing protein [Nocardioides sp. URHA0020]